MISNLFLEKYLKRIKLEKALKADLETLKEIQMNHLLNVPFENLYIFSNKSLSLEIDDLFEKIVNEKKGGICYELNGLFLQLLKGIGYDAKYICAKIREEGTYFDHVLVMVTIENQEYICDVGFRDNFLYPIKIVPNIIQKNHNNDYKINKLDFNKYELIKINQNHAQRLYTFITEEKSLNDFSKRCKYYETTPDTYFTKSPFCALDTKKGKLFLTSDKFVISEDNNKKTIEITNKDEFNYYLEKYFDIII